MNKPDTPETIDAPAAEVVVKPKRRTKAQIEADAAGRCRKPARRQPPKPKRKAESGQLLKQ